MPEPGSHPDYNGQLSLRWNSLDRQTEKLKGTLVSLGTLVVTYTYFTTFFWLAVHGLDRLHSQD